MTRLDSAPIVLGADQRSSPSEFLELEFLGRWSSGSRRFARHVRFAHGGDILDLLPSSAAVDRMVRGDWDSALIASNGDDVILMVLWGGVARVTVLGETEADARALADEVRIRRVEEARDGRVDVHIWSLDGAGKPNRKPRRLAVPAWSDIERNYPPRTRGTLASLMEIERPIGSGRLLLWHGPPGTGKTTAIRALMAAWEPWCRSAYVVDPERLFDQPHYLSELLVSGKAHDERWRLIIAEDTDDHLRSTARQASGAALGRLLNFTDGILGQGADAIVLLTTNEPLANLHPAVTRPGRCLAVVEFSAFTPAEARAWLGGDAAAVPGTPTLAQLLVARGDIRPVAGAPPEDHPTGTYL